MKAKLRGRKNSLKSRDVEAIIETPGPSETDGQAISSSSAGDEICCSNDVNHPDVNMANQILGQERFDGHFDAVNNRVAEGWACSLESSSSCARVEIWAGDTFLVLGFANVFRSDLAEANVSNGYCAFAIPLPDNLQEGEVYQLSARIAGTDFFLPGGPVEYYASQAVGGSAADENIDLEAMVVPAISSELEFDGRFDSIVDGAAEGWAHWVEEARGPALVELWAQDTLCSVGLANIYRKDLADSGIKQGKCGFKLPLPQNLPRNKKCFITVKIAGTSKDLEGSPIAYFSKEELFPWTGSGVSVYNIPQTSTGNRPYFYFDKNYYLSQCVKCGISPALGNAESYLQHYLDRGARLGLSPNPFFDEDYYLRMHPDVAREIQIGRWLSGFEHFLKVGAAENYSPVWFFDADFYRDMHPELTDENMAAGGFPDRYSHYLLVGIAERRSAHWAVHALRAIKDEPDFPIDRADLSAHVSDGVRWPAIFEPIFDYDWMKEKYDWGRSVRPSSFIKYYLLNVKAQKISPSPHFDESFYLSTEPDIEVAVKERKFVSGYHHFLLHGMKEWRRPFEGFDPHYYFDLHMGPRQGEPSSAGTDTPFSHFLRNRRTRRLAFAPPLAALDVPENLGKALYEKRCRLGAAQLGSLALTPAGITPDVSIIIIARDNYDKTANSIVSSVYNTRASLEIVLFDNASFDDIRNIPCINPQIKYLRAERNLGFTIAVNRAAAIATGRMILLLNNDVELTPGAIDIALATLDADRSIGVVGGKIVRMHGSLQDAGSIVWQDGSCLGYGRDRDPLDGQVSFLRDVDFCSGCFFAVMRAVWQEVGGFDEGFAPAYYEETDFCIRVWEQGLRVVYDPRIVIWHYEFGSSANREEPLALMRRNQRYFASKHRAFLAECSPPSLAQVERARLRHIAGPRVLCIEDQLPDPKKGMGFVRSSTIIQILQQTCGLVSVIGLHNQRWPDSLVGDSSGRHIEILTGVNGANIDKFFGERVGVYDIVWLSRTHNLAQLKEWRMAYPAFFAKIRIVLDTEAVAATRRFGYAQQAGQQADLTELVLEEFEHLDGISHICVVNELDRKLLVEMLDQRGLDIPVTVLGHSLSVQPALPAFEATTDIVLVGAYSQPDGPNADGLLWFDRDVRPWIQDLPGLEFVIAGSEAEAFVRAAKLKHHYRVVSNPASMSDVYRTARVMVAPTRFAAGIPMKVHEAASYGVPVAMTNLLADQLGWRRDGVVFAPTEAAEMAVVIKKLALDPDVWHSSQALQSALVAEDCDPAAFALSIRRIVYPPTKV